MFPRFPRLQPIQLAIEDGETPPRVPPGRRVTPNVVVALLRVADVISTNDVARPVLHRLIARDVRLAQNGHRTVVGFTLSDSHTGCGLEVECRADRTRPVVLLNSGGSANNYGLFSRKGLPSSLYRFSSDNVHDVKVVVDLGSAEIQARSIFATDGIVPFYFRRTEFRRQSL